MKNNPLECDLKMPNRTGIVYESPKLTVFGPVGMLTQAGSGADSELMFVGMPGNLMCVNSNNPNAQDAMC